MDYYVLGAVGDRVLVVKKGDDGQCISLILKVKDSDVKAVEFPIQRWAALREQVDDANVAANRVMNKQPDIKLRRHIGGGYYISVTSGYYCVDIRKFYRPYGAADSEIRATKRGVALRFSEWSHLCSLIPTLNESHPSMSSAHPCYFDHLNQMAWFECSECNPFPV